MRDPFDDHPVKIRVGTVLLLLIALLLILPVSAPLTRGQLSMGRVTGSGSIDVADGLPTVDSPLGIGTFGFVVERSTPFDEVRGQLEYVHHVTGARVQSVEFLSLVMGANTATFGGTCRMNGVFCTFAVTVVDDHVPGASDTFFISVLPDGPRNGGPLRSGNIQIH